MDTNVFIQILINLITISLRVANNERSSEKPISYSLRNFLNSTTWLEILIVNQIIDIISIENSAINILWSVTKYTFLNTVEIISESRKNFVSCYSFHFPIANRNFNIFVI